MVKLRKLLVILLFCFIFISLLGIQGCKTKGIPGGSILKGIITDVELQVPINKVKIEIKNNSSPSIYTTTTDSQGRYQFSCEQGYYTLKATKNNYLSYERTIIVGKGVSQEDFYMSMIHEKPCTLEGTVTDAETGKPLLDATIQIGSNIVKSDKKGNFKFDKLPEGQFNSWVTVPGYEAINETVALTRGINIVKFKLKKMGSKTSGSTNTLKRNPEFATNPTSLEDYKALDKRWVYPQKTYREYFVIAENRYTKYVKYSEVDEKGEVVVTQNEVLKNTGLGWSKIPAIELMSQPDTMLKFDLDNVLTFFNFQDPDIIIESMGTEKINNYQTKKFRMYTKTGTPKEKKMDLLLWIITNNPKADLNNLITRVKGTTVPETTSNTWADIDLVFYDIGNNNKVPVPKI